jgi:NitT/TauT family transport system permease protein
MNRWKGYTIAAIVLLILWQSSSSVMRSNILPGPKEAFGSFVEEWSPKSGAGLKHHLWVSSRRVIYGIGVALISALPVGLLMGRMEKIDNFLAPLVFLTYPLPKIVFLPIVLLLLGIGDSSKVFLIALIVFFQILVTVRDAARSIPKELMLSINSLGATKWQVLYHVVLPVCLPDVLTALRIGTGTAIAVLFFVESFATSEGLGYFIMDAWGRIDYQAMFAGIIGMGLLGIVMYELLEFLERRLCRWRFLERV